MAISEPVFMAIDLVNEFQRFIRKPNFTDQFKENQTL